MTQKHVALYYIAKVCIFCFHKNFIFKSFQFLKKSPLGIENQ